MDSDSPLLDRLLAEWPFEPSSLTARIVHRPAGGFVIQMRVDLGILQLEAADRPDGTRPFGARSMVEHLAEKRVLLEPLKVLTAEEMLECDREFVQFYHRRICWLALRRFAEAARDARHTLKLMDICRTLSPSEAWTQTHEQYRPFVLFHRIQAEALSALADQDASVAIEAINAGLPELRATLPEGDAAEEGDHELIDRLLELRESLRERFQVGQTLEEQLRHAIATEQYELAAKLRDALKGN